MTMLNGKREWASTLMHFDWYNLTGVQLPSSLALTAMFSMINFDKLRNLPTLNDLQLAIETDTDVPLDVYYRFWYLLVAAVNKETDGSKSSLTTSPLVEEKILGLTGHVRTSKKRYPTSDIFVFKNGSYLLTQRLTSRNTDIVCLQITKHNMPEVWIASDLPSNNINILLDEGYILPSLKSTAGNITAEYCYDPSTKRINYTDTALYETHSFWE